MSCDSCMWGQTKNSGCSFDYVCNNTGRVIAKPTQKDGKRKPKDNRSTNEPQ